MSSSVSIWDTLRTLFTPRRLIGLSILATLMGAGLWWLHQYIDLTPAGVRALIAPLGQWGAIGLTLFIAIILVVPVVPATIAQIGAGLLYGPWLGFMVVMIGDIIGAMIGFVIARRWGRHNPLFDRLSATEQAAFNTLCQQMTPIRILLLRVLPGPAYTMVSLAAGCSPMPWWRYILASILGVTPALVLLTIAGDISTTQPLVATLLGIGFVGLMVVLNKIAQKYNNSL
ncbi:MAG: TVP38/TMEM64 family protein [Roseiflexaceae bacterium]|jgi:uncharacterized membrane protein YdjX (TVP38/TMEM64 family)